MKRFILNINEKKIEDTISNKTYNGMVDSSLLDILNDLYEYKLLVDNVIKDTYKDLLDTYDYGCKKGYSTGGLVSEMETIELLAEKLEVDLGM